MQHREYTIKYGDSLHSLALVFYQDASKWHNIAEYNKLMFPYIIHDINKQMPNVLNIGDKILIPTGDSTAPIAYGDWLDILCGEDLDLASFDVYGDVYSRSGVANMEQAIEHRLCTEKGELKYHPEYGSNLALLVGKQLPYIEKAIELEIIETLYQDDRIEHVEVLDLHRDKTAVLVTLLITLQGQESGTRLDLTLPFGGR